MQNLEKVQYITRHFGALQGLKAIPFGVMLLLMSTRSLGMTWLGAEGDCTIPIIMLLAVIGSLIWINQYYARVFGKVQSLSSSSQTWGTGLVLSLFGLLILIERNYAPPFSPLGLGVAAAFLASGLLTRRYYYLPFVVILLITSFLPLITNVPLSNPIYGSLGFVFMVVIGMSTILVGIIDHLQLVKAMRETPGGSHV